MSRQQGRSRMNLLSGLVAAISTITGTRVPDALYRRLQSEEIRAVDGDLTTERLAFLVENAVRI